VKLLSISAQKASEQRQVNEHTYLTDQPCDFSHIPAPIGVHKRTVNLPQRWFEQCDGSFKPSCFGIMYGFESFLGRH